MSKSSKPLGEKVLNLREPAGVHAILAELLEDKKQIEGRNYSMSNLIRDLAREAKREKDAGPNQPLPAKRPAAFSVTELKHKRARSTRKAGPGSGESVA